MAGELRFRPTRKEVYFAKSMAKRCEELMHQPCYPSTKDRCARISERAFRLAKCIAETSTEEEQ